MNGQSKALSWAGLLLVGASLVGEAAGFASGGLAHTLTGVGTVFAALGRGIFAAEGQGPQG